MSGKIHRFDEVTSTQDAARLLLSEGRAWIGDVIVADSQIAGRGRFGREWRSPIGGLYATFILNDAPLLPLSAGVAVALALERFGLKPGLKWPNDIVIGGRKLGGIIIEKVDGLALVGIGINLRKTPLPASTCASEHGVEIDCDALIEAIRAEFNATQEEREVLTAYRARSATIGLWVSISRGPESDPVIGTALEIDEEGRLLVETESGVLPVASGECFHLLSAPVDSGRFTRLS